MILSPVCSISRKILLLKLYYFGKVAIFYNLYYFKKVRVSGCFTSPCYATIDNTITNFSFSLGFCPKFLLWIQGFYLRWKKWSSPLIFSCLLLCQWYQSEVFPGSMPNKRSDSHSVNGACGNQGMTIPPLEIETIKHPSSYHRYNIASII